MKGINRDKYNNKIRDEGFKNIECRDTRSNGKNVD